MRDHIVARLGEEAGIECGREDVILSRGPVCRLTDCMSVQLEEETSTEPISDNADTTDVRDVRNDADTDVGDVHGNTPDGRSAWIKQQLMHGVKLKAPHVEENFGCSLKTAERDLKALKDGGVIEYVGAPNTGHYKLRKGVEKNQRINPKA